MNHVNEQNMYKYYTLMPWFRFFQIAIKNHYLIIISFGPSFEQTFFSDHIRILK